MSFARKQVDAATDKVRAFLKQLSKDFDGTEEIGAEIFAETAERQAAYGARADARKNRFGKLVAANSPAAKRRKEMAAERQREVREARQKAASRAQAMRDEFMREQRQRQAANSARSQSRTSSSGRTSSSTRRSSPVDDMAAHYKTLEVSVGAEFSEIKKAYRRLMRKYHPDRHGGNPKKEKAAHELSMKVSLAYQALEKELKG